MSGDVLIRTEGRAGRITLDRPAALNALSYRMTLAIDAALKVWRDDPAVDLVLIDAAGTRAFCAGGDLAEMYETGTKGDHGYGRCFWRDEYRMDARIAEYPKPVVSFLHGFVMGGGVGVGCHARHRIVGESVQVAMPECGIGLVPDVGGSLILARAPGCLGEYLSVTGARMGPADAILAGFADRFVPEPEWPALTARMIATGEVGPLPLRPAPPGRLQTLLPEIDAVFSAPDLVAVCDRLTDRETPFAQATRATLARVSPLSAHCAFAILRRLRDPADRAAHDGLTIRQALRQEYRFTFRAAEHGDFLEGIRAAIIDKDRSPRWRHSDIGQVTEAEVEALLAPLGPDELSFEEV